jgi:pyruvate dehydrogenase E2 component (dihydrolipoamide acetyltransferase)
MRTFQLPDLGEGLHEAHIVSWHAGVGEHVVADQPLVSVETDKAVVEVPAPWSGRLAKLHCGEGEAVAVGAPLADIETEDAVADAGSVVGTLPAAPRAPEPSPLPAAATTAAAAAVKAAPAVRRRAAELGVELAGLAGSGPGGALTIADLEAAARGRVATAGFEPLRGVRRAMAEAMSRVGAQVAVASVTEEAVIDAWPADADATIRLIRAIAAGCRAAPALNAWLDAEARTRRLHEKIDLGIAIETDDGLFVPVLRDVLSRSDDDLRRGLDAMKLDVTRRTVPLAELKGQTITLSNFGMLGGLAAVLTVMPPQVAILGAGRIHRAPRVVGHEVRVARVLPLSLTFDHRAVTGAEAIKFLGAAIGELEKP